MDKEKLLLVVEPEGNVVESLHPLTKIIAVFTMGISAVVWPDPYMGLVFLLILFVVAWLAELFVAFTKLIIGFAFPLSIMLIFMQGFYSPRNKTYIANFGFAKLGLEGVISAGNVIVSVLVFLGSFYLMNKTTYVGAMVAALSELGLHPKVGYLILASLKVVPQMQRRMLIISQAQRARGLRTSGNMFGRLRALIPLLGPVVLSSLTDAQERGMTLETRGFGVCTKKRTNIIKLTFSIVDYSVIVILCIIALSTIVVSIGVYAGIIPYWGGVR